MTNTVNLPDQLDTFAYCCPSHRWAVSHAAGVEPLTSPPMDFKLFNPGLLAHRDLLYFSLHGMPQQPYWYGDNHATALHIDAFQGLDLSQTVVFVANCYLASTPFLDAILACNPRFLLGGTGKNYTRRNSLVGAHLLGSLFVRALNLHIRPSAAFALARYGLRAQTRTLEGCALATKNRTRKNRLYEDITANQDALHFQAFT